MDSGYSRTLCMDVIEEEDRLIGYVVWEYDIQTLRGHILNLAIAKDDRRKGKGTMLLNHVLEGFRTGSIRSCYLEVRESNTPARRLYESNGFSISDRIPGYYFDEDAIVYVRNL